MATVGVKGLTVIDVIAFLQCSSTLTPEVASITYRQVLGDVFFVPDIRRPVVTLMRACDRVGLRARERGGGESVQLHSVGRHNNITYTVHITL